MPYVDAGGEKNHDCTQVMIEGWVTDLNGFTVGGAAVHIWSDRGHDATVTTDGAGHYQLQFLGAASDYQTFWHIQMVQNGAPASPTVTVPISADCVNGFQAYRINWRRIR
jgi:hypothetical protein